MKIAIHCAELDASRIDGTRIYVSEMLKRFGALAPEDRFYLFHRKKFNRELAPSVRENYEERRILGRFHWTQTRFVPAVRALQPDIVWMPIQMMPFGIPQATRVVVTVHDLAFEYYPETFPWVDRWRHDLYLRYALRRADHVIAITESTKRDILRLVPTRDPETITVVYHGFDASRFTPMPNLHDAEVLKQYNLESGSYVLYVGALQPRKNLVRLVQAFTLAKREIPNMKLVLVGDRAWLWKSIEAEIEQHSFRDDIIMTGAVSVEDLPSWYRHARVFVYPSLYEGFGIPLLEAFASGVPVLTTNNSSLPEVGGDAPRYVDAKDVEAIAKELVMLWQDVEARKKCIAHGLHRTENFSWNRCAEETLAVLTRVI